MENIIDFFNSWSGVTQSLIAAAIFLVFQKIGSKALDALTELWSKSSKQRRITRLNNELARLNTVSGGIQNRTFAISVLLFRAARRIVKGLIWISLGLTSGAISPTLSIIGFVGGLYYFFSALAVVSRVDADENTSAVMKEIDEELTRLKNGEGT